MGRSCRDNGFGVPVVVRILGPLEVISGGRRIPIRGGKERALLVRLALGSGRAVSPDLLVAALWDGKPPASADASVRVLLSRVRKALSAGGADDVIRTRPPGYVYRSTRSTLSSSRCCPRGAASSWPKAVLTGRPRR